ncbi:hypothetical protein [Leisingera sp. McT4-56]|uniref:hypothetical protein n=1 Tax=Leisingera sp. McT4-56 TaxID=2881255 RepID=UPI001CF7EDBE|nr:hypothetical protein [Leisingera sp. McT4-56]MCB4455825.1 hypothetical protein [Leisingera sp. McT4-56]
MFLEDVFLENAKSDLEALVARHRSADFDGRFQWDPFIAKSMLQKAIRRANTRRAEEAAWYLLRINEQVFWRRLCIIALEDIGLANIPLVAQVLQAEGDRQLRSNLGGPEKVGLALVSAMCASAKDRTTDDLIDAIGNDDYNCCKADVSELPEAARAALASSTSAPVHERAIAALQLSPASTPSRRVRDWCLLLERLPEATLSPCVKAAATLGLQRTKSEMALHMALLSRDLPETPRQMDEVFPPSVDLNGLPSWVLDGHTRIGLQAFRLALKRSPRLGRFIRHWATGAVSPAKTVAGLVFRVESSQLKRRLDWSIGQQLKQEACNNRPGLPAGAAPEGLAILREEFDLVNECRADAVRVYLR